MAAYAALVSLLNNIHAVTNHPHLSTSLDKEHIHALLNKTNFLLDFIEGNNYGGGSEEVRDLERKIAAAAHAAEDLIESHIVDQINVGESGASLACSLDLQQSIQDMDVVMEMVIQIKEKGEVKEEKSTHLEVTGPLVQSGESFMVGLDGELIQLLDGLTRGRSSRHIISIVGMGGSGKTTLAKNVYENLRIKKQFQLRAWATISQQNNAQEVLKELLSCLGKSSSGTIDHSPLGDDLHRALFGKRYLIVLDDIWSVQAWDEVKRFFPDNNNGSRVLLTTRLSILARYCGSSLIMMNLLDEENSWKLFCEKAFHNEDCPPELWEVSKEIVKLCQGLSKSIVVIGEILLKSPRSVGYWKEVAHNLKANPNSKEKQESLDVLSLIYNHLPPHLKPCFLYMGVFKEDSDINVSKIIRLWIAEGFVKPRRNQSLEDIAEGYINDLIDRNLILVGKRHKNGKVRSCLIHDLLRDLSIKLAEQEEFLRWRKGGIQGTKRRLLDDWYMGSTEVKLPLVRSIITEQCTTQPTKHRLLRVLDEGGFGSKRDYCENVNLRYLCCHQWDTFDKVSLMWNLQFLINKSSFEPFIAPVEIWKVQQLRQVLGVHIYLPSPPSRNEQVELLILDNLRTLKTIVNLRLSKEVCEIIPNIRKLYLCYDRKLHGYDDSLIECLGNVSHLQKLESLNIRWPVSGGKLDEKLIASFPRSLQKLSLSGCELDLDDMTIIGSLPQLQVLKLEDIHVLGEGKWSTIEGEFFRLRFLLLKHCKNLVSWYADSSHFPVLEKLILDGLLELEEIPLDIGEIPTLQLIDVDFCSISAAISAINISEEQAAYGNAQLRVEVRVAEWHRDLFTQALEAKGLTVDDIHFKSTLYDDTDDEAD